MTAIKSCDTFLTVLGQVNSESEVTGRVLWHDAPVTPPPPSGIRRNQDSYETFLRGQIASVKVRIQMNEIYDSNYEQEILKKEKEIQTFSFTRMSLSHLPIKFGEPPRISIGLLRQKRNVQKELRSLNKQLKRLNKQLFDYLVEKEDSPVD